VRIPDLNSANTATSDPGLDTLYGETMGTRWRVVAAVPPRRSLHDLHDGIQAQLDGIVAQMSTWEHDSDLSRFNRAPAMSWQVLPDALFKVMACALDIAHASNGAYDPTVGPLVDLWGFGPSREGHRIPDADALLTARDRIGWQSIELRHDSHSAWQPGAVSVDLSAIAKGYGVDAVVAYLHRVGIARALVDVGGELYGLGCKPDGTPWRVLVDALPDDDDEPAGSAVEPCVLRLRDMAAATSGDRWHRFEHAGRHYSHTLDPRTGMPVAHDTAAVTVVAADAMRADAWATALTVMGGDDGLAFATRHGIAARFVTRDGDGDDAAVRTTSAFEHWVGA